MSKYNPNATVNPEIHKGANIAFLKDFLAKTGVDDLASGWSSDDIKRLQTLLSDSIKDDLRFEKYFPMVAFAGYYSDYGHAIHRNQPKKHQHQKNHDIDWSDPAIVAENRRYVRYKLIPSCCRKIRDMLNGKAYWQIEPDLSQERADALNELLRNVSAAAI